MVNQGESMDGNPTLICLPMGFSPGKYWLNQHPVHDDNQRRISAIADSEGTASLAHWKLQCVEVICADAWH